eukprot:scaffold20734_cov118-Isochrysis_galbana.AAC.7
MIAAKRSGGEIGEPSSNTDVVRACPVIQPGVAMTKSTCPGPCRSDVGAGGAIPSAMLLVAHRPIWKPASA